MRRRTGFLVYIRETLGLLPSRASTVGAAGARVTAGGLLSRHGGALGAFLGCPRQERRQLGIDPVAGGLAAPEVALQSLGDVHCRRKRRGAGGETKSLLSHSNTK